VDRMYARVTEWPANAADDEQTLVDRALADRTAFAAIYTRYVSRVFQYLLTYADSPDDAADLTQIVFLRAFESLPTWRRHRGGTFAGWLFRIAHNAAIDAYRRRRRTLPWDHLPEYALTARGPQPETAAVQHEALNRLRVLVAELSVEKQEMLALRFAAGLTVAETAVALHKSEAAVRKQLNRTVRALKEQFDDYGL
jgi:RNA polymerase sigma-70 factor (ECF subfamily)